MGRQGVGQSQVGKIKSRNRLLSYYWRIPEFYRTVTVAFVLSQTHKCWGYTVSGSQFEPIPEFVDFILDLQRTANSSAMR